MGACHEQREFERLLRDSGAEFIGMNCHEKWRLPNGVSVIIPVSGSDHRGWKNALANLRRILAPGDGKPKDTPRVPNRPQRSRRRPTESKRVVVEFTAPPLRSLAEQVRDRLTA